MAIAEKLTTIAENQQKVYDAGYEKGKSEGGYDEGYTAGQQAEYDRFWDVYQAKGNRVNYSMGFAGAGWNDETVDPKYIPIVPSGSDCANSMFSDSKITELADGIVDFSQVKNAYHIFRGCPNLVRLPRLDLSKATTSSWMCGSCPKLEEIECIVVNEALTYTNFFYQCSALKEVRFEGVIGQAMTLQWSANLSDASIQSIIEGLADLTGQTTQTLTFHATAGGKLTDAQKAAITAKNWTLIY